MNPADMSPADMNSANRSQQTSSPSRRSVLRQLLDRFSGPQASQPRRGRLLLESLESRQLMAGDVDLFATDSTVTSNLDQALPIQTDDLGPSRAAQGEPAPDLVQFAIDLADNGVQFFGAHWCPACTQQKELFQDGANELPFIEVTNPDRSPGSIAIAEGITNYPTWEFSDGSRLIGVQSLQTLSDRSGVPIPQSDEPTFETIGNQTVGIGSPLHIPVDVYDPDGGVQKVTVSVENPALLEAVVLSGNRSIRIDMDTYGDMVFELFEQRAPEASGRVIELAEDGFYDGIIFHRVVDNFVIQAGDPTGTGTSGSSLGNFDDDFNAELQHNRPGVLSFAKTSDDTNNSQFFITETPTRHLDFNHSIFGQLVEGEDVREAISEHAVNGSGTPTTPIAIESISVFDDTENSVIMFKAAGTSTGTTNVTITVTDPDGNTHSETIQVTVAADTANSQPFLNEVVVPASFAAGAPATLQLSSIDVEGDAVTYLANSQSAAANATVSVDENSGLVTVTPSSGFTGAVNVLVGVQPGSGVIGNSSSDFDTQLVTFNFESNVLAAPSGLDLDASTDSGASNTDSVTNTGTLTFNVSGVTDGAEVAIVNVNTGTTLGLAIASGGIATINTANISALGDGTYSLAARQTSGGVTSALSAPITVVYDSTNPASVLGSTVTSGNVGRAYSADLISPEEGNGLTYALTTSPTGATIDAATGQIAWTPTSAQIGANSFTVVLTDLAGNTRTDSFSVQVADEALVEIGFELLDTSGNPVTSLQVGQRVTLNINATDARSILTRGGLFAAYIDVLFDNTVIRPVAGTSITFGSDLSRFTTGNIANGLIDEVGGTSSATEATQIETSLIASIEMEAIAAGTTNIRSESAENSGSEILLFGINGEIPTDAIAFGNLNVTVGASFTVNNDTFTLTEGEPSRVLNVLANDTINSGNTTLSVISVTQPNTGGSVTLSGSDVTFTPDTEFAGQSIFTYRVGDSTGLQQTGTVTVNVTSVNDPPVAVADAFSVNQGSSGNVLQVLANDTTEANETLQIISTTAPSGGGSVTIAAGGQSVLFTPGSDFAGTDTFSYVVSDGSLTSTGQVTVTVISTDSPPTANADSFSLQEDSLQGAFNVIDNDVADSEGQAFLIDSLGTPTQGGSVAISSDANSILYRPALNFFGTETVTYTIRDTGGGLAVGTATFSVAPVNDAPPISSPTVNVNRSSGETSVLKIANLPTNVDGTGETLTFTTLGTPSAGGTVRVDSTSGDILYTPPSGTFVGTDTFTFSISDGSLTSNGTLSVVVNDFIPRNIIVQSNGFSIPGIRLVGNADTGEAVVLDSSFLLSTVDGSEVEYQSFGNVLPGSYTIEVPAVPFLINGETAQQIAVQSDPEDGDTTIESNLGRLRPEFISIRDWLGSAARQSVLVAVAPGGSSVLSSATSGTTTIKNPTATLDSTGANLTLAGLNDADESIQAVLNATGNRDVQMRGEIDGLQLFKINVSSNVVSFTNSNSAAQGELIDSPLLAIGDGSPQGELVAASATTLADVFVPGSQGNSSSVVLPTTAGDVWLAESNGDQVIAVPNRITVVDEAMSTVSSQLQLLSSSADAIAASDVGESPLSESAIDQAIRLS
ncbi:MAG: tandem-95 repeat protein [Pirellulaceae bacterium]